MKIIPENPLLFNKLENDPKLHAVDLDVLLKDYEDISREFHKHFSAGAEYQHENALFHKIRYLELLGKKWEGRVLDVGNDKPFLSFFLRKFNSGTVFDTISNEIPQTPFILHEVDIEMERFPFDDAVFDQIIFTEVIEHLWRNPSHCVFEINRVMKLGGSAYVTTPNPCDRHSLVCILWQANPNQRSGYFASLESGHLHLWTAAHLRLLFECHGFVTKGLVTQNLYGHTKEDENIEKFIRAVSNYCDLMNETVVLVATKAKSAESTAFPTEIYPDGQPVQFQGAITGFAESNLKLV
ncbi:MAG: methyltransferase domain-containing protein [Methylovulum sp.]|nr:methyltransferase domain-containing protein [Methylovulum sp.]